MAATFDVHVAKMSQMDLPGPEVYWMSHWDEWFEAWFLMVVARNDEHVVVVNTGPPRQLAALNDLWRGFHPSGRVQMLRGEDDLPDRRLAALGISPQDVDHLVITPLVGYTLGSLELFENAEIHLSRRGWIEDVFAPPYDVHVPRSIFLPSEAESYLLGPAHDRLRLADEGEIVPGVRIWWAGVHHRSSLAVEIDTPKGRVIASDCGFSYGNIEGSHYLGVGESYAEAMVAYKKVRDRADIIVPLYDKAVFDRYPGGHLTA
ncbi:MAG TPA: hypothetical protein VMD59_10690 [Acidimicrobiales bacterium]|nr:hypothetical protein [Acidimicrobiales bacterium]